MFRLSFSDPKHRRTRSSLFVETDLSSIIIDISEDFRIQSLREQIKKIDYALITHAHAGHVGGIPDIRAYTIDKPLPIYGSRHTVEQIRSTYSYIFDSSTFVGGGIPSLETIVVNDTFFLDSTRITPIVIEHGRIEGCFELPQLWNVLIGKISFVGPRPDVSGYADTLNGDDVVVLELRPGITGPATLYFRNEEELLTKVDDPRQFNDTVIWPLKVAINKRYIQEWNFFRDIGYIVITIIPWINTVLKLVDEPPHEPSQCVVAIEKFQKI